MTTHDWNLGDDASRLDLATLRAFRWWHNSGRDFLRSYLLTQLALAAILTLGLAAVPSPSGWAALGAVAAVVAPIAAWIIHRRRYGWRAPASNARAAGWGITAGLVLFLVTGVVLMVLLGYVAILISMLSAQGPLGMIPAFATGAGGWFAAAHRKRRIDDPIYPVDARRT